MPADHRSENRLLRSPSRLLGRCLLALLSLLALSACRDETTLEQAVDDRRHQVIVIAVDGLDPNLLRDLAGEGRLPNLSALIRRGSLATIDCVVGTISPVVWTTVATGVAPERHGIHDFVAGEQLVTSNLRRVPAFWNVLPGYGLLPATLGWMVTWPAEDGSGIMISDRAYWGTFEDKVQPPGVVDLERYHWNGTADLAFLPRFTSYPYDPAFEEWGEEEPGYAVNYLLRNRLVVPHVRDRIYTEMAIELLQREEIDLLALYYRGIDFVSHGFWQYFEPEPFRAAGWTVDPEEVEALGDIIPEYHAFLDREIGRVLEHADEDALVVVLSDHGFGTALGEHVLEAGRFLSGNHRSQGVLILSGPQVRKGRPPPSRITHFEILPTLYHALGVPIPRDLEGYPLLPFFTDEHLAATELSYVDAHDWTPTLDPEALESSHDEELIEDLRSLGYVK